MTADRPEPMMQYQDYEQRPVLMLADGSSLVVSRGGGLVRARAREA